MGVSGVLWKQVSAHLQCCNIAVLAAEATSSKQLHMAHSTIFNKAISYPVPPEMHIQNLCSLMARQK